MKIPKKFKLFATTINVVWKNEKLNDQRNYGTYNYCKSEISLSTTKGLENMSADLIEDVFYHEKIHCILAAMGEDELSENEKFIEVFSRLLRQTDESAEF